MYYSLDELVVGKLEYGSGASAIPYDGKTRYIRITDIDDDGNLNKEPMTPSEIDEKYLLNDGDVLFARTGATVGKTYRYIPADGKCIYAGYLIRAIPNQRLIRPDYLWLFTKSPQYWQFVRNSMKVVAQPNINAKQYGSIIINVPSLEEQDTILSALLNILDVINKRKKQLHAFDTLIKARFVEMFGTIDKNPSGFPIVCLQDVCEQIKDGTHQTPEYTEDTVNGFKFLSSKDVTSGKIDWHHLKYIPKALHEELYARIAPRMGDILLAKNGTTGIAAIVDTDDVFDIYVSLALLRPIDVHPVYLWAAINSDETKRQFDASLKGIGVPNLHLGEIKKARVLMPPKEMQNKFASFVSQVDKSKVVVQAALEKAQLLFDSLMQQYFG